MKKTDCLLTHRLLKSIADSTIKAFIPLIIYKQTGNLTLCFFYIILERFLAALGFIALKKLIHKFTMISLIISVIPLVIAQILLLVQDINIILLICFALLNATYSVLYFGSLNITFANIDSSTNTAKFETGQHLGRIIFTLLSAYILGNLTSSFAFVVIFSISMYVLSMIPILIIYKNQMINIQEIPKFKTIDILKDTKYFNIYHIFTGIFSFFCDVILPLYLYINGLSLTVVGTVMALAYLIKIAANYLAKFLQSKNLTRFLIIFSSCILFAALTFIFFTKSNVAIYIATLFISFAHQMLFTSLFSLFVKDQKQKNMYYDSLLYRDIFQNIARGSLGCMYLIVPSFTVMFGFAIFSSVLMGFSGIKCVNHFNNNSSKNEAINS